MVVLDALLLLQTNVHDHFRAFHRSLIMSFLVFEEFSSCQKLNRNWPDTSRDFSVDFRLSSFVLAFAKNACIFL